MVCSELLTNVVYTKSVDGAEQRGVAVGMEVDVGVKVRVAVLVGVTVEVDVAVRVNVGVPVIVSVPTAVSVSVSVLVRLGASVPVPSIDTGIEGSDVASSRKKPMMSTGGLGFEAGLG